MSHETRSDEFQALANAIQHQRAIRVFDGRDVEDHFVEEAIRLATFAPSGGNRQPSRYIVVRDRQIKQGLGQIFDELAASLGDYKAPDRTPWEDVPVLVAVVTEGSHSSAAASVYPGVQNFLLAIQAQGLGSVLTTRWKRREAEVNALLGLPEGWETHAILPVGWPTRPYGRGTRVPVREVVFRDRFGTPWEEAP